MSKPPGHTMITTAGIICIALGSIIVLGYLFWVLSFFPDVMRVFDYGHVTRSSLANSETATMLAVWFIVQVALKFLYPGMIVVCGIVAVVCAKHPQKAKVVSLTGWLLVVLTAFPFVLDVVLFIAKGSFLEPHMYNVLVCVLGVSLAIVYFWGAQKNKKVFNEFSL
jgi:uncharacterized protein YqhQ